MSDLTDEQFKKDKQFNVQLEWLKEQGADLRARTQAEYLYTAAALALYGGVCWGVAALPKTGCWVATGVVIVAGLIVWKIVADHETYSTIWKARTTIIGLLEVPEPPPPEAGGGYRYSVGIVVAAAFLAALFCLLASAFAGSSCAQ